MGRSFGPHRWFSCFSAGLERQHLPDPVCGVDCNRLGTDVCMTLCMYGARAPYLRIRSRLCGPIDCMHVCRTCTWCRSIIPVPQPAQPAARSPQRLASETAAPALERSDRVWSVDRHVTTAPPAYPLSIDRHYRHVVHSVPRACLPETLPPSSTHTRLKIVSKVSQASQFIALGVLI